MVTTSDEPPEETNGSGTPVIGRRPMTAPMLTNAWTTNQAVMPDGQQHAEAVGGAQGGADAEDAERDEQADDHDGADQAELLADDGEDEVGVGVGQEAPLGPAGAEARRRSSPPEARPTSDWMVW